MKAKRVWVMGRVVMELVIWMAIMSLFEESENGRGNTRKLITQWMAEPIIMWTKIEVIQKGMTTKLWKKKAKQKRAMKDHTMEGSHKTRGLSCFILVMGQARVVWTLLLG